MTEQKMQFDAEVGKVLHLMINSLYTNKDIFLRELISNSSDACDKLRYLSQTDNSLLAGDNEFKINIKLDKEANTITIADNGIGMNRTDLIENLGTIAKSGTQNFAEKLSGDKKKDSQLIGQFGVGFYSCFMVADEITVISKKAGEQQAYSWKSDGKGAYLIADYQQDCPRGTEITLHIKESEKAFLDHFRIKHIIKSYSDHIAVPIFFTDENNTETQVNSSSALWSRDKGEITTKQYQEFYKNVSHTVDDPWLILHNKNEGAVEFTNLLFVPTNKTFDLFHPDRKCRVKLYIKRVFIADENVDLVPQYLRFLRGVVDSEDLPLNISRETLQHNATLEKIKKSVTKRVLGQLIKKKNDNLEEYLVFWHNFGGVLKEGLCEVNSEHEKLLETCVFESALHRRMISLDEYITNIKQENKIIYYLTGDDAEKLRNNPQIEGFLAKNIDVLLFTDTVDDFWVNVNGKYKDIELKSVTRSDISLDEQEKEEVADDKVTGQPELIDYFKETLGNLVKDVKLSKKLANSPACLAVDNGAMDIRMERYLIEQKQLNTAAAKILEINPNHKIIQKISKDLQEKTNQQENAALINLLYDQACIIEGQPVTDAGAFSKRFNDFLAKIN